MVVRTISTIECTTCGDLKVSSTSSNNFRTSKAYVAPSCSKRTDTTSSMRVVLVKSKPCALICVILMSRIVGSTRLTILKVYDQVRDEVFF